MDFIGEPDPSADSILTGIFRFHPLAVDDALQETHTPKVDDWGEYLYIVLNAIAINREDGLDIKVNELDVFLGRNYIVTHHDTPIPALEKAWNSINSDKRYTSHGPDHLLYKIIDDLVADYWPLVKTLDAEIDWIEDQVFTNAKPELMERMFALKRALVSLRRIITPQREVLNRLARDDFEVVDSKDRIFFRDIYDHLVRLHDLTENHARPGQRYPGRVSVGYQQSHERGHEDLDHHHHPVHADFFCDGFLRNELLCSRRTAGKDGRGPSPSSLACMITAGTP